VPWNTQANDLVWQKTREQKLAEFIVVMNVWLLTMQEWDGALYTDVKGRFYDDDRRQFGPPHASSTGVYLEGLADAYKLALELGDSERAARYLQVIRRGVRSVMQLQYVDDVDMFYISRKDRVRGGLRTRVYDNEIRVDNIQHNLLGLAKLVDVVAREAWAEP
jgi:hypothetical protein